MGKVVRNSLIIAFLLLLASGSAFAQATRTWVSGVGDDVNPCSRTAPCKTFAGAISKTAAGGIINCIDPGGFGAVTITKSMTISCKHVDGSILATGTTGVSVNGAGINVVLRGLDIDGSTANGIAGIKFLQGNSLIVEHCVIRDFTGAAPNGHGIAVLNSSGVARVHVSNTDINGNGVGDGWTGGTGILVSPSGSGSADVTVSNSNIANNVTGIRAESDNTTGAIDLEVTDTSLAENSQHGITASASATPVRVMLIRAGVSHNLGQGIRAVGAQAIFRVGSSVITGNAFGLNVVSGGLIQSYGNNQLNGNGTDGGFSAVALH